MTSAAMMAVGLYAVNFGLLLSFHVLGREVSIVREAVSDYAHGATARLFQIYGAIGCLAALVMGWLLHSAAAIGFGAELPGVCIAMAAARAGLTVFPSDLRQHTRSRSGTVHHLCAITLFACAVVVIHEVSRVLAAQSHLPLLKPVWPVLHWTVVAAVLATLITSLPRFRAWFGLAERAFVFASATWFMLAAIWFLVPKAV